MKVIVVFDYTSTNMDSKDADRVVDSLVEDLTDFADDTGHIWSIKEVLEND